MIDEDASNQIELGTRKWLQIESKRLTCKCWYCFPFHQRFGRRSAKRQEYKIAKYFMEVNRNCLYNRYLIYKGKSFKQVKEAPLESSFSLEITNLFMEDFQTKAIKMLRNKQNLWLQYVDGTSVISAFLHRRHLWTLREIIKV